MRKKLLCAAGVAVALQVACGADTKEQADALEHTGSQSAAETVWVVNVRNAHSGMCLNVLNWSTANGANVVQAADCSINSSKWKFVARGGGFFNIKAFHSDQCLNVLNFGNQNGADVVQALDCDEYSSQWWLEDRGNGLVNIRARHSGQCLNVLNWGTNNGADVVQAVDCNIMTSRWYIPTPGLFVPTPLPKNVGGPVCDVCLRAHDM
jgi:hypothetical protein